MDKWIVEGNRLIAEFMGIPKCGRCKDCGGYQYSPAIIYKPADMMYHDSWDWLMPVVEKISRIKIGDGIEYVEYAYVRTFGGIGPDSAFRFNGFAVHISDRLIDSVFRGVVEFVKWHNENVSAGEWKNRVKELSKNGIIHDHEKGDDSF